jgi:hypothetical protein
LQSFSGNESMTFQSSPTIALARWGGKAAVLALIKHLEKSGWSNQVIGVLAGVKDERIASAVAKELPRTYNLTHEAAFALVAMGPVAEKSILSMLNHKDPQAVGEACWVLAEIGGLDRLAALEKLSTHSNPFLARSAAQARMAIEDRIHAGMKK